MKKQAPRIVPYRCPCSSCEKGRAEALARMQKKHAAGNKAP